MLGGKTYRKNVIREIRSTRSRFLSIFGIVLLGVAMLTGLLSVAPDMRAAGNRYFRESRLCDIRILSTLGLTDADIDEIRAVDGVESVMPVRTVESEVHTENGDTLVMRAQNLPEDMDPDAPDYINQITLQEGRLPEKSGECAVQALGFLEGVSLGDTITLADGTEGLAGDTYTIVGIVQLPTNFSIDNETSTAGDGSLDFIALMPESEFTADYYTACYLTVEGAAALDTYSEDYDACIEPVLDRLEELGKTRAALRRADIVSEAQAELDDAKQEYEDQKAEAEAKLADAEAELDEAQAKLDDAKAQLEEGEAEYADGKEQLAEQRENLPDTLSSGAQQVLVSEGSLLDFEDQVDQLEQGVQMLELIQPMMSYAKQALDQAEKELEEAAQDPNTDPEELAEAQLRYETALEYYNQIAAKVSEYQNQIDSAKQQLYEQGILSSPTVSNEEMLTQLKAKRKEMRLALLQGQLSIATAYGDVESAEQQLEDARQELDDGWAEYDDGVAQLEEGRQEFEQQKADAEKQLEEAEDKINDAQAEIDDIAAGEWYVLDRDTITSFATFEQNADRIADIARVFPVFFFLVAALVALTTMTRMVEENRQQIGTLKALGYSEMAISAKYLAYALTASLSGAAVGLVVGFAGFPSVIWIAYSAMYRVPSFRLEVDPLLVVASLLVSVAVISVATLAACHAELAEKPASLMLPKAPPAGKRILLERIRPLWRHMSFSYKVTARNLLRYKKRFFMTVLGVAGCTALLLVGFGIQDSIMDIVDKQYTELNHYDLSISLSNEKALTETRGLSDILSDTDKISYYNAFYTKSVTISNADDAESSVTFTVCEDDAQLTKYFTLRTRQGHQTVPFDAENGVVLTEKTAEMLDLSIGDTFWLHQSDGTRTALTLTGITENYVSSALYMTQSAYAEYIGEVPAMNTVYAMSTCGEDEAACDALSSEILGKNYITSVSFIEEMTSTFTNVISCIDYVVLLVIVCAAALAAVVLYNLININIAERKKELATIKVLGFFDGEVQRYIFREIYLLSLIGALVGLAIGVPLHQFIIRTVEIDQMMFIRRIAVSSYFYSVGLTMVFTFAVSLFMRRLVNRISMVESMKAPE